MATVAKRKSSTLLENVKTIVYAGLIAIGIRTFLVEPFNIPSGSMIPTLLIGDYLFVSKFSYGYSRYSFPFAFPPFSGRIFEQTPHRGDVAVFRNPVHPSEDYIKRIIGLPGDHISVRDGILYVNGQAAMRKPDGNCYDEERGPAAQGQQYLETLPNGVTHEICKTSDYGFANNTPAPGEYIVPPGHVFAMGDNRDNSADSRFPDPERAWPFADRTGDIPPGIGFVPIENLVGRAEFIFFSVDARDPWWQVWNWPFEVRWNRLFTGVH